MKKTFTTILILVALVAAMVVTEVIASPVQPSYDTKTKKTPGAQATANAIKKQDRQNDKQNDKKNKDDFADVMTGKKVNLRGTVVSYDGSQLVISLDDGSFVTVFTDTETKINIPSGKTNATEEPTLEPSVEPSAVPTVEPSLVPSLEPTGEPVPVVVGGLYPGVQVKVSAYALTDGTYLAIKIQVIPGKPVKAYHVGTVYAYTPGASITIVTKKGEFSTYLLTESTKVQPEERVGQLAFGSLVTIISPRDVTGAPLTAAGIVIHPLTGGGVEPTGEPTIEPTIEPTGEPTIEPTEEPTSEPSGD